MTRLMHPPELDRPGERDRFDPVVEGALLGLARELSLMLWQRICADTRGTGGRLDEDRARQQFRELAARVAARGGRLRPDVGRLTRVEIEDRADSLDAWCGDALTAHTPGRDTLVAVEERRRAMQDERAPSDAASPPASAPEREVARRERSSLREIDGRRTVLSRVERAFGTTLADVVIRTDERIASLDVLVDTDGREIGFAPGRGSPSTPEGQHTLAHELAQREHPAAELIARAPTVAAASLRSGRGWELWDPRAAHRDGWRLPPGARPKDARPLESRRIAPRRGALDGRVVLGSWERTEHVHDAEARLRERAALLDGVAADSPLARLGRDGGDPLADELRARMEQLLGHGFAHVRVHADLAAAQAASALGARAFAVGQHVYFGAGLFQPGTLDGDRLIAHELTHVRQHDRGALARPDRDGLGVSQPGDAVEQEAAAMERSVHRVHPSPALDPVPSLAHATHADPAQLATAPPSTVVARAPKPAADLSTPTLLATILDRLGPLVTQAPALEILRRQVQQDRDAPPADIAKLRRHADRLSNALVTAEPALASIASLRRPESYLPTIAERIVKRATFVQGELVAALMLAYSDVDPSGKQLTTAQRDLGEFADFIIDQTLGPDGVERLIAQVAPLRAQIITARGQTGRAVITRPADLMAGFGQPSHVGGLEKPLRKVLDNLRRSRAAGSDVGEKLRHLVEDTRSITSLMSALAAYEQFIYWSKLLEDSVFGRGRPRELAHRYRDEFNAILSDFEKAQGITAPDQYYQTVQAAASRYAQLAASATLTAAASEIQDRLGTISTIHLIEKIIVITAAAAFTAGLAGSAAAGLAGEVGLGGLAGAASFGAEVVAFTTVSRMAESAMIGPSETSFGHDLAINALTFGVLKAVNRVFAKIVKLGADPSMLTKAAYRAGSFATVAVSLQLFAEAQHVFEHGSAMSNQQRASSIAQNAIVMAALELGHFIVKAPAARGLGSIDAALGKQLAALGGERAAITSQLEALRAQKLTPEQVNELLAKIQDLYGRELQLFDAAAKRGATQPALKAAIAVYQQQIALVELKLARAGVANAHTGPQLFQQVRPGVVGFQPAGRPIIDRFYAEQGSRPVAGQRPGELIGTLPDGETTHFLPDELVKDEQRAREQERKVEARRKQLLDEVGSAVGPEALPRFTDLPTETLERLARRPAPELAKLARLTADELARLLALPELQFGRLLDLPADQLTALVRLAPDQLAKLGGLESQSLVNLARRTPAELQRILALEPADVKIFAELKFGHATELLGVSSSPAHLRAAARVCSRFMAAGMSEKAAVDRTVEIGASGDRLLLMGNAFQGGGRGTSKQVVHADGIEAHEVAQAIDFIRLKGGGGQFEFGAVGLEGIEGHYVPEGAKQRIPVSMKVFTTPDASNVLQRADLNAGHVDASIGAELFAYTNADAKAIYDLAKTPPPGGAAARVFKRMTFVCRDGTLIYDSGRWQPPR